MARIGSISTNIGGLGAGASAEAATMAISNETTFAAAVTLTISYERIDKLVTVQMTGLTATLAAPNPASVVFAGALPASLRPAENVSAAHVMVWTNGARSDTIGKIKVDTNGVITMYRSAGEGGLWTGGASAGWDANAISYRVP